MDCAKDKFSIHGECRQCPRCSPGHELKQECGYGVGGATECVMCERRWFKPDWGSYPCRMCQNCRHLNRQDITPCTHTHNAVCGDCLPGFYSKRRLDGLQDLECLPCGSAHIRHTQCETKSTTVEAQSSEAPPLNTAILTTACVMTVAVATILLIIMVLTHRGFNTCRKTFQGCLSPRSHRDIAAASVSIEMESSVTQEAEYGCLELSPVSLPVGCGSVLRDINSCGVDPEVMAWAEHGPVECTEREILHGEKRILMPNVSPLTGNTSPPGAADATANTTNIANTDNTDNTANSHNT